MNIRKEFMKPLNFYRVASINIQGLKPMKKKQTKEVKKPGKGKGSRGC